MNRRHLIAVAVVASSLAVTPAVFASPVTALSPAVYAMFGRGKTDKVKEVRLTLNNSSNTDRKILAGDKPLTIAAGTAVTLQLPAGTRITTNDEAKSLIIEVAARYNGTTITLK